MNFIINSIVTSSLVVVVHRTLEIAKKTNFNISLLQIGAKYVIKWGIFYYQLDKCYYKIGATSFYYKLGQFNNYKSGQVLLQIGAAITN